MLRTILIPFLVVIGSFLCVRQVQADPLPFTVKATSVTGTIPIFQGTGTDGCPSRFMINGELWVINGHWPTYRWKGPDIEHLVRQPDGSNDTGKIGDGYGIGLGGMWFDSTTGTLYDPTHLDGSPEAGGGWWNQQREILLSTSRDTGRTWVCQGPIIMTTPADGAFLATGSGTMYDGGNGDHYLFVDEPNGYFYIFAQNDLFYKPNTPNFATNMFVVARCKISDKMAPGKWYKWHNGTWTQPGIFGKASVVNGFTVMYSSYLKKYISFGGGDYYFLHRPFQTRLVSTLSNRLYRQPWRRWGGHCRQ